MCMYKLLSTASVSCDTTLSLIAQKSDHWCCGMSHISMNELGTGLTKSAMKGECVGMSIIEIHTKFSTCLSLVLCHENT